MEILLAFGYFEINNSVLPVAVLAYAKLCLFSMWLKCNLTLFLTQSSLPTWLK